MLFKVTEFELLTGQWVGSPDLPYLVLLGTACTQTAPNQGAENLVTCTRMTADDMGVNAGQEEKLNAVPYGEEFLTLKDGEERYR